LEYRYPDLKYIKNTLFCCYSLVLSSNIEDITYGQGKIFLATDDRGTGPLKPDGSIDAYLGRCVAIEYIDLNSNEAGIQITDLIQVQNTFGHIDVNGIWGGFETDLGKTYPKQGIVHLENSTYMAVISGGKSFLLKYPAMAFSKYINFGTQEPTIEDPLPVDFPVPVQNSTIPNNPEWGGYVSIDGILNGNQVVALNSNGNLQFYNPDSTDMIRCLPTGIKNATGVTEVNNYLTGADLAVADANSITWMNYDGTQVGKDEFDKNAVTINEIDWDASRGQLWASMPEGIFVLNQNKTFTLYKDGATDAIEAVKSLPGFYDYFIQNTTAHLRKPNGEYNPDVPGRDTHFNPAIHGLGFTKSNIWAVTDTDIIIYDKLEFQDHIQYCIYGPDINADKSVDLLDLALMVDDWLVDHPSPADLTCDCRVDLNDLALLAESWQI
jgi:hypothetical protein